MHQQILAELPRYTSLVPLVQWCWLQLIQAAASNLPELRTADDVATWHLKQKHLQGVGEEFLGVSKAGKSREIVPKPQF